MHTGNLLKKPAAFGAAILMVVGSTGCATKKHVRQTVAPVEARVSSTEKKTADHASAIGDLENNLSRTDERAMDADRKAVAAGQEAAKANEAARMAHSRADEARQLAESGMNRIGEVVENIDNYKLVTTEAVLFPVNRATLTKEAKAQLDAAVANVATAKNYILEIQGFTDKTGSKDVNLQLSQRRADAVVRYLTTQHNVPLRKINVLGLGVDNPVADNKTRAGRKQNRRVELKVFALDLGSNRAGTQASTTGAGGTGATSPTGQTSTQPTPQQ